MLIVDFFYVSGVLIGGIAISVTGLVFSTNTLQDLLGGHINWYVQFLYQLRQMSARGKRVGMAILSQGQHSG